MLYKFIHLICFQIKHLAKSKNWRAVLLLVGIFGLREFGGHTTIFMYPLLIFKESGMKNLDDFWCTIIVGVMTTLGTFMSALFLDRLGRRFILIGTASVSTLSFLVNGLVLLFGGPGVKEIYLVCVFVQALMSATGMFSIPFVLLGELAPPEVKFWTTTITFSCFSFFESIILYVVPIIVKEGSLPVLMLGYFVINAVALLVLYFILPETKRKTMTELGTMFGKYEEL